MCNKTITNLSIALAVTVPFKWVWYFNHCVWLMLLCLVQLHKQNPHMYSPRLIKQSSLLNASRTYANKFMKSWRIPLPSTSSNMTNIGCHTSLRWATKFGCICRNNALPKPIERLDHFDMSLTSSPRMWEKILLSSTFPHSLSCTECSMWATFG